MNELVTGLGRVGGRHRQKKKEEAKTLHLNKLTDF